MTGSPYPAPCLVPENLPTAFLLPMPPVFGTVLACLLPDKPVFRPLDHHEPFRHGAHTRRAERAADLSAGLPVGTLRPCLTSAVDQPRAASAALRSLLSGQRPAGVAFLSWLLVFMALVPHWCPVLAVVVVPPCAACRASTKSDGRRPSIYREGEPTEGWGNPEGVPRPQAANGVSIFRRWSSYPQRGQVLKI